MYLDITIIYVFSHLMTICISATNAYWVHRYGYRHVRVAISIQIEI